MDRNYQGRLFINMEGYKKDVEWAKCMEKIILLAVRIILGDKHQLLYPLNKLTNLVEQDFDSIEKKDYYHLIHKYKRLLSTLDSESGLEHNLTAEEICNIVISGGVIHYFRDEYPKMVFKTQTNKEGTKFYHSKPMGLPRKIVRPWVVREFGLHYSNRKYFTNAEINKYHPYTIRARKFVLELSQRDSTMLIKNSILIPNGKDWDYQNSQAQDLKLISLTTSRWMYPHPNVIEDVWVLIDELYTKILDKAKLPKTNEVLHEILGYIAQIHWLMSQAKIYRRGNAGIADMFVKAILDSIGITTPNWRGPDSSRADNPNEELENFINKHGVAPDLEAFVTPLNKYINTYIFMMCETPSWIEDHQFIPQTTLKNTLLKVS